MARLVTYIYTHIAACIITLATASNTAIAQNIVTGGNDELTQLYTDAVKHITEPEGHDKAILMLNKAIELGNTNAECYAMIVIMENYGMRDLMGDLAKEAIALRQRATEINSKTHYYNSYMCEAKYQIKTGRTLEALATINKMTEEAQSENNKFGLFNGKMLLGHIYQARNNPATALANYQEALKLDNQMPGETLINAEVYANIANCHISLYNLDKALQNINKGLSLQRIRRSTKSHLKANECKCYFMTHQLDTFISKYNEFREFKEKYDPEYHTTEENNVEIYKAIYDKDYNKAIELNKKTASALDRADNMQIIYRAQADYKTAYCYLDTVRQEYQKLFDSSFNEDISSMNATLEHEQMKQRHKDLEIERNKQDLLNRQLLNDRKKLMLNKTSLEINNANETLELQNAKLANRNLEIENREISLKNQKLDLQRQQEKIDYEERRQEQSAHLSIALIVGLTLISIGIIVFILQRERNIKRLHDTNDSLQIARHKAIESQMKAEKSEKMKSSFIQNTSHEIRTPLNAICGFSQILADEDTQSELTQDQREELSRIISENTDLLTNLVNDILYISDLESGKYKMKYEKTSVNEICRMAIKEVIHKKKEGVDINFATNIESSSVLYTDRIRTAQVLINLLNNAIKRTDHGEICLYSLQDQEKGYIVFAVTDTGNEIPADKAEIIFDRFEKVETRDNGTGLGLSICKLIAEKEGGWIKLDTTYKGGAKFIFAHPAV